MDSAIKLFAEVFAEIDPFDLDMKEGYDSDDEGYNVDAAKISMKVTKKLAKYVDNKELLPSFVPTPGLFQNVAEVVGRIFPNPHSVPLQYKPIDDPHFLDDKLASTPCYDMSYDELLFLLNAVNDTNHSPDHPAIRNAIEDIRCMYPLFDFGTVYAMLRPRLWPLPIDDKDSAKVQGSSLLGAMEEENLNKYQKLQKNHDDDIIHHPRDVRGRRLWDLLANRVIPLSFADGEHEQVKYFAVSHSWADASERWRDKETRVNHGEWPVPLPVGVTLDRLRTELYNLGARYIWLDVVCLRQHALEREDVRREELAIDMPTMGNIYNNAEQVVVYYNGLGKEFQKTGWDGERHWFKRVWTMLEAKPNFLLAGVPDSCPDLLNSENEYNVRLQDRMEELGVLQKAIYHLDRPDRGNVDGSDVSTLFWDVEEVRRRYSEHDVDKIDVLRYSWCTENMPHYHFDADKEVDLERAWTLCVKYADPERQLAILFLLPPNESSETWIPSWNWISHPDNDLPSVDHSELVLTEGETMEVLPTGILRGREWVIMPGFHGFLCEQGERFMIISRFGECTYEVEAVWISQNVIFTVPYDGPFTLISTRHSSIYLVCEATDSHDHLKKLCSVRFSDVDAEEINKHSRIATVDIS